MPTALHPIASRRRLFPRSRRSPEEWHRLVSRWCWRIIIVGVLILGPLQLGKHDWSAPWVPPYCPEHNICLK